MTLDDAEHYTDEKRKRSLSHIPGAQVDSPRPKVFRNSWRLAGYFRLMRKSLLVELVRSPAALATPRRHGLRMDPSIRGIRDVSRIAIAMSCISGEDPGGEGSKRLSRMRQLFAVG